MMAEALVFQHQVVRLNDMINWDALATRLTL
jgi:hypothetical protein